MSTPAGQGLTLAELEGQVPSSSDDITGPTRPEENREASSDSALSTTSTTVPAATPVTKKAATVAKTSASTSAQQPFAGAIVFVIVSLIVVLLVHMKLGFLWALVFGIVALLVVIRIFVPRLLPNTASRPVPTQGREKTLYGFLNSKAIGMKYTPKLSQEELRRIADSEQQARRQRDEQQKAEAFARRTKYLIARLRQLANLGIQPIVSVCNIKSGSKTTIAVYVGSVIAEFTRKNVLLLPATQNTATSTAGVVSGIAEGSLITVSELSQDIEKYGAYRVVSNRLPLTKHGLGVVCEDANSVIASEPEADYAREQFERIVRTLYPNLDVLFLDHGNDDIRRDSVVLSAVRFSDVLAFVAMAPTPISVKTMGKTIDGYNTDRIGRREQHGEPVLPGERIATRDKVQHSVIAISGFRQSDSVDIEDLVSDKPQTVEDDAPPTWQGEGFYVPWDPYIASEEVTVCDLSKIQPETLQAFLEIAVAVYEETARVQGIENVPPGEKKPAASTNVLTSPEAALATTPKGVQS